MSYTAWSARSDLDSGMGLWERLLAGSVGIDRTVGTPSAGTGIMTEMTEMTEMTILGNDFT